jgi:hypothetical protein
VSVTGAGGLSLTPAPVYADNTNAGTANASYTYAESANHLGSSDSEDFTIGKAATVTTVTITGAPFTYTGSAITPATVTVTGAGGLSLTPAPSYNNNVNAGTASASYTYVGDGNHFGSSDSKDFTIGKKLLTVTAENKSKQYSDPIPTLTYNITGFIDGEGLDNLTTSPSVATSATASSGPGSYDIVASGGSASNYSFSYVKGTLLVTQEDAIAEYSGLTYFSTASATSQTAKITLSATVTDINDSYRGDISKATVEFHDGSPTGTILGSGAVGLVSSSDPTVGTATAMDITITLSNAEMSGGGKSLTVYTVVNGYYTGVSVPEVITISPPAKDNVSGGGFLMMSNSAGTYQGKAGSKNNFGFTMKYNKSGKNLQGQTNFIIRASDNKIYQIKSNAINSMAVNGNRANFSTKANITDITNPLSPIPGAGNLALMVEMFDSVKTGQSDSICITLQDPNGGLLYSSYWNGKKSVLQSMRKPSGGGNISVMSGSSLAQSASSEDIILPTEFALHQNYPNPFNPSTTIVFDVPELSNVSLTVFDMLGRRVQTIVRAQFEPGSYHQQWDSRDETGSVLPSGMYILRIHAKSSTSDRELISVKKMMLMK